MGGRTNIGGRRRRALAMGVAALAVAALAGCLSSGRSTVFSFTDANGKHCVTGEAIVAEQSDLSGGGVTGLATTAATKGTNCDVDEDVYTWSYLEARADLQRESDSGPLLCASDLASQSSSRLVRADVASDGCGAGRYRTVGTYGYRYGSATTVRASSTSPYATITDPHARPAAAAEGDGPTRWSTVAAWAADVPQGVAGPDGERVGSVLPSAVDAQRDRILADLQAQGVDLSEQDREVREALWTLDPVDVVDDAGTVVGAYGFRFIALADLPAAQAEAQATVDAAGL